MTYRVVEGMTTRIAPMRLLAFGGPLNEQVVDVPENSPIHFAAMPPTSPLVEDTAPTGPALRRVVYTVEKVAFHDDRLCRDVNLGWHSDSCVWTARCLVADGYPKHRITDALNALSGVCEVWALQFAGVTDGVNPREHDAQ